MRVVLIHRYFWPDTPPYAQILKEIALRLGEAGHEVTVLTCSPSYNRSVVRDAPRCEQLAPGVEVRRWPVVADRSFTAFKALNLLFFCVRLLAARREIAGADVVMAASTPPIAVAKLASWLAHRGGAGFVYHKQDIYPEVVTAAGVIQARGVASLLRRLDARTDRASEGLVVLSADMAETVRAREVDSKRIAVINNFDPWTDRPDASISEPTGPPDPVHETPLRVVFAGNLGRFQNLEVIVDGIVRLGGEAGVDFDFFGDGPLRKAIERTIREHDLRNVHLHGYRPPAEVAAFLRSRAHLGIVSLLPGVIRAAYPSKTMSYLRNGCPVLAVVEHDSDLVRSLVDSGAGLHASPTDPDSVAARLSALVSDPSFLVGARQAASKLYAEQFGAEHQLGRWTRLFAEVGRRST